MNCYSSNYCREQEVGRESERELKTAVVWQRSHTCHHQRSWWHILHFPSSFFSVPPPLPSYRLFTKLSFRLSTSLCVWEREIERKSETGKEKLQTFLCMFVLRWEGNWDECVCLPQCVCVCQSERRTGRWEGSVSCHIWGEMRVHAEVRLFSGVLWTCWMRDLKSVKERRRWRD